MRCISTSECAVTARLKRKNLCCASSATEAEAPRPKKWICRGLDHPNEKLVELLLVAGEARRLGAKRLILVTPYLAYMRQDI
ncbi:ribose-phosphate pyrophosphokinase-like domain-containing protein, partial [Methylobacterium organophilum]|nr:ribose-phosphate pyrophosphokinase-like domain-containing protein [Methylobacterium organophilum]